MTPQEKAADLVRKFSLAPIVRNKQGIGLRYYDANTETDSAKQCAMIAADAVIGALPFNSPTHGELMMFWQKVKEEIIKL